MKRVIVCIMTVVFVLSFTANIWASESKIRTYSVGDVTVTFDDDCSFSNETCERIAYSLAYGNEFESVQTYNLWCTLFGHDYNVTGLYVVNHKVYSAQPRCVEETYKVSVCSRCEHTVKNLTSSRRINCCS